MTKPQTAINPDLVLEYWKRSKITLVSEKGYPETLSIQQLWQILHNMTAEEIENDQN